MNQRFKFIALLFLWLFLILRVAVPNSPCGSRIEDLRKAAEKGDAEAQHLLGLKYGTGEEVSEDYVEAVKWYRKAAEQGLAAAQRDLGWMYSLGQGVPKNDVEAVKWFRKAAEQGDMIAQFSIGQAYRLGKGVSKNLAESLKWYRKAAEQGLAMAQLDLGSMHYLGEGVAKNDTEAVKWYRRAAEQGNSEAQLNLGIAYAKGEGVPKNDVEAVKWYRRAAELGFPKAQLFLGNAYQDGTGVPRNFVEALAWYNIAAASGNWVASANRDLLEKKLDPQVGFLYQQRSNEILKEIEIAKQKREKIDESDQRSPNLAQSTTELKGSGTGVFVNNTGLILTAAHVVGQSSNIRVATQQGVHAARVVKLDTANDLALLKCEGSFQSAPIKPSSGIKLGQSVFTIGFPNIGFQCFSPKMTKGEINSLSGLQDDPRHWQISVPVQPGNSGGPLFDEAGNVVGVVLSKLDAVKVAKITGDLPQNVNYAIKSIYALPLLEPYAANLASENAASASPKTLESVVEKIQGAVVLILVY